eukprot:10424437-Alexandrium_andersonii.AAC.1
MPQNTPLGSFGANFEAVSGPAQFQVRTPEANLCFAHGGLRIEVDCGAGLGQIANCTLGPVRSKDPSFRELALA